MLLMFHLAVAFSSMGFAAYTYVSPSKSKFLIAYSLAAATLGSGTMLLLQNPAHLLPACITGIIYLSVVSAAIFAAQRKFAHVTNEE